MQARKQASILSLNVSVTDMPYNGCTRCCDSCEVMVLKACMLSQCAHQSTQAAYKGAPERFPAETGSLSEPAAGSAARLETFK
jgi:hypothetical protein